MNRGHRSVTKLPDEPGVYFFVGPRKEVLYVGKATSLADRVRSYFGADLAETRGVHMVQMVERATRVEFRATDSVLEALILEARLIKELKPLYNTREKDDKSFNYMVITTNEMFPRLLTVRGKDLERTCRELQASEPQLTRRNTLPIYGPFPHAAQFKEALRIVRKIFPYYDCARPVAELVARGDKKLRFNQSIGVYPSSEVSAREYARTVRHIRLFFEGKKRMLMKSLEREMHRFAQKERFEEAARAKRQLFALQHIEDVSLIRRSYVEVDGTEKDGVRVEGYDVAHLGGKDMTGVMTVVVKGIPQKSEYRTFNIRTIEKSNDTQALAEMLERRLAHVEWEYPRTIVVDGGIAQLNRARKVLRDAGVAIPVVAVTKDEKHRPKRLQGPVKLCREHGMDILLANAEAHRFSLAVHRRKRGKRLRA